MISFEGFLIGEGSPIYQQILLFIKRGAVAGTIADGDELPSRRVLSALLGVNPNTIARAFTLLEEEGYVRSIPKKGIYVLSRESNVEKDEEGILLLRTLRDRGIPKEQLLKMIEEVYTDHD